MDVFNNVGYNSLIKQYLKVLNMKSVKGKFRLKSEARKIQVKKMLQEQHESFNALFNTIEDFVCVLDMEGNIIKANRAVFEKLGYLKEEILNRSVLNLHLPEVREDAKKIITEMVAGTRNTCPLPVQTRSGKRIDVETMVTRGKWNDQDVFFCVSRDITAQKEAERELYAAYKMQQRNDCINDFISSQKPLDSRCVKRFKEVGVDLSLPLYCCLLSIHAGASNALDKNFQKNKLITVLSKLSEIIVWDNKDYIGVFGNTSNGSDFYEYIKRLVSAVKEDMRASLIPICLGVSDIHKGPAGFLKSYQEARSSVLVAKCQENKKPSVIYFNELGLYQLLAAGYNKKNADDYVKRILEPLLQHDLEKGTDLISTLETILYSKNMKEAAKKVFLHYKTLLFRKTRIEKILGLSLDNFENRLAMSVAIKLHKLNSHT